MLYADKKDHRLLNNVIISYRHDAGLLSEGERNTLILEASSWLSAWEHYLPNMAISATDQAFCADILRQMKAEYDKRCEIYKHGVDLTNYQNTFTSCLMSCLLKILNMDIKEEIEWWLFDSCDKVYTLEDKEFPVEEPLAFIQFLIMIKSTTCQ